MVSNAESARPALKVMALLAALWFVPSAARSAAPTPSAPMPPQPLSAAAPASAPKAPDDVNFRTSHIEVGKEKLAVEIADNPARRERGLMNRTSLADGHGMLFVFGEEQVLRFWMKNTLIPLAIGYFDSDRKLVDIQEMVPASPAELEPKTYPSSRPAKYALEVPKGWFERHKVGLGTRLKLYSLP